MVRVLYSIRYDDCVTLFSRALFRDLIANRGGRDAWLSLCLFQSLLLRMLLVVVVMLMKLLYK